MVRYRIEAGRAFRISGPSKVDGLPPQRSTVQGASNAAVNYVGNGDFSHGRDGWMPAGNGAVVADPQNKQKKAFEFGMPFETSHKLAIPDDVKSVDVSYRLLATRAPKEKLAWIRVRFYDAKGNSMIIAGEELAVANRWEVLSRPGIDITQETRDSISFEVPREGPGDILISDIVVKPAANVSPSKNEGAGNRQEEPINKPHYPLAPPFHRLEGDEEWAPNREFHIEQWVDGAPNTANPSVGNYQVWLVDFSSRAVLLPDMIVPDTDDKSHRPCITVLLFSGREIPVSYSEDHARHWRCLSLRKRQWDDVQASDGRLIRAGGTLFLLSALTLSGTPDSP